MPAPRPLHQRLRALAAGAEPAVAARWETTLRGLGAAVDQGALAEALRAGLLGSEPLLTTLWEQAVDRPLRVALLAVLLELAQEAATMALDRESTEVQGRLREPGAGAALPDVAPVLAAYVGVQLQLVRTTTLQAMRALVRDGLAGGRTAAESAAALTQTLGLTPRQVTQLEALRAELAAQGVEDAEQARILRQAWSRALRLRARQIAGTQSAYAVQAGQYLAGLAAVEAGHLDPAQTRRYWNPAAAACAEQCKPVPGLNPEGVGLTEAFETPLGPALFPPLHPWCKCGVDVVRTR